MELLPPILPDVFCGQPLLVVGKYEGVWPAEAQLRGVLPTGEGGWGGGWGGVHYSVGRGDLGSLNLGVWGSTRSHIRT
jgi:hypothetical protein